MGAVPPTLPPEPRGEQAKSCEFSAAHLLTPLRTKSFWRDQPLGFTVESVLEGLGLAIDAFEFPRASSRPRLPIPGLDPKGPREMQVPLASDPAWPDNEAASDSHA